MQKTDPAPWWFWFYSLWVWEADKHAFPFRLMKLSSCRAIANLLSEFTKYMAPSVGDFRTCLSAEARYVCLFFKASACFYKAAIPISHFWNASSNCVASNLITVGQRKPSWSWNSLLSGLCAGPAFELSWLVFSEADAVGKEVVEGDSGSGCVFPANKTNTTKDHEHCLLSLLTSSIQSMESYLLLYIEWDFQWYPQCPQLTEQSPCQRY